MIERRYLLSGLALGGAMIATPARRKTTTFAAGRLS